MYPLMIRRLILITTTTPLKSLKSFKSLRFSSTSSENNQNPVVVFFEDHGFSKSQISVITKKLPRILSARPEKTLLPKLLFLQSQGLSAPEVAKLVTACPYILRRSLNKHIIPSFHSIQDFLQSEEKAIAAIQRFGRLLECDHRISVCPNIEILRQIGFSHTTIETILFSKPRLFVMSSIQLKGIVEEVKEMGLNPLHVKFIRVVSVMQSMSKSTWEKKVKVYRKWGWTEEEVISAFGRHSGCMAASENKIDGVMDYFVNQMGCESSFIARNPVLLTLSFKGRIVPRGSVYLVLSSEGLIKKDVNRRLFNITEKRFFDKFIKPHEKHIPGLLKLYEEKLEISESKEV